MRCLTASLVGGRRSGLTAFLKRTERTSLVAEAVEIL